MVDGGTPPTVSDRDVLATFAILEDEWLDASDVADELPVPFDDPDDHAHLEDRLDALYERGLLERNDEEHPTTVWRLDPDARVRAAAAAAEEAEIETDVEAQAAKTTDAATPPRDEETPASPPPDPQESIPTIHERMPDAIQAFDPPGTPEQTERRRGALHESYVYLRRRGRADREDLEEDVFPEVPGDYERPEDGWWDEVVRPGFDALPDVEPAEESDSEAWTYTGEEPAEEG